MNRESLLPRSLFSASTLKRENNEDDIVALLNTSTKRQRRRSLHDTEPPVTRNNSNKRNNNNSRNNNNGSNSSSSSSSSSSEEEEEEQDIESTMLRQENAPSAHINHTMHSLLLKLERQQSKQNKYMEKLKHLNKTILKTNRLISYHANQLTQVANQPPAIAKRSAPTPVDATKRQITIHDDEDDEEIVEPVVTPVKKKNTLPTKIMPVRKVVQEIEIAKRETMDIFTPRRKEGEIAFKKKPRSLLYNIADDHSPKGISDLMITTSMDGELQFWNAQQRKRIKTIGSDHLYDTWIDDICWVTPTTLAFCPPQKSDEPVKLIHIGKTTRSNVEGRIQSLDETNPHENGISIMQGLDTGEYQCSFLTGGYDKSVYIWNLKRESLKDNFSTTQVNRLQVKHTSYLLSLCYDKYRHQLLSGGADERLVTFDLQTDSTVREMKLSQRINHIHQNKANPHLMLITLSSSVDQFSVYDQRCPGYDGLQIRFGQHENENFSRYIKPDLHENGYTVCCGSQTSSKLHFWDLRYTGVSRTISFSMDTPSTSKILVPKFIPNTNTIVSVSSTRTLSWIDYQVKKDEIVKTLI